MQNQTKPHAYKLPRDYGAVNWLGLKTLITKEVNRFLKVIGQTITAPVINALLFYAVFAIALGGESRQMQGVPYMSFLVPGLVMMSMAQNAFANTSSSIIISKVQGNIVDILMPPLSPLELTLGFAIGGIFRGLMVGIATLICLAFVAPFGMPHPFVALYHAIMGSLMLALLGIIGGVWADKFDRMAAVTNFIIQPATFLSGTFYTAAELPGSWALLCHLNPFFYMIDGFRYGFTGISDGTVGLGLAVLACVNGLLFAVSYAMIASGYKIKS